ncbi:hypothetical protein BC834DRAFT_880000 [Gloeopeniophorella convolvens]|nr:hypothetical protein BC834DRAFT_880000 [Gloeopeniophorella convolvens]
MPTTSAALSSALSYLSSSPALQQLAPLAVVFLIPLLVFAGRNYLRAFASSSFRMLAVINSALPWNWSSPHEHTHKHRKKHAVRTRAGQLAAAERDADGLSDAEKKNLFYPGLVNISGTYCFMNSTMQALASLQSFLPYIDAIHAKAEAVDVPTPVVDALRDLLHDLNAPTPYSRSIRPVNMIAALSQPEPGKRIPLFSSREHQDAQELFQLVSEYVKKEATAVDREGTRDLGFGALASSSSSSVASVDVAKGVFEGLTAHRRSCCECGYTEAVMHFPFDNWQLAVPRLSAGCRLEECLAEYTRLEVLTDCICRHCSMRATLRRLEQDAERLAADADAAQAVSASKKKRVREARRLAARVKAALDEGRVEEDIKGVKLERVFARASTKQAMVARPPPVLALHLNRSHFSAYATKNNARVQFPATLDLTPYTTSGTLNTTPSAPLSAAARPAAAVPRVLYRLTAAVCHYGQHSFGHYVCFRRAPDGRGWLRASDDAVRAVPLEAVLAEGAGAFMLYYERIADEPAAGDEKVPLGVKAKVEEEVKVKREEDALAPMLRARIVRSVALTPGEGAGLGLAALLKREPEEGEGIKRELQEAEVKREPANDSAAPALPAPAAPAKPEPEIEPARAPPSSAPSVHAPVPVVDEPPIAPPRTVVGLRA